MVLEQARADAGQLGAGEAAEEAQGVLEKAGLEKVTLNLKAKSGNFRLIERGLRVLRPIMTFSLKC